MREDRYSSKGNTRRKNRYLAELNKAVRAEWVAACKFDQIDPATRFVVFSKANTHAQIHDRLMERKLRLQHTVTVQGENQENY